MNRIRVRWSVALLVLASLQALAGAIPDLPASDDSGRRNNAAKPWKETKRWPAAEAFQAAAADDKYFYAIDSTRVAKYDRATGQRLAESRGDAKHLNSGFWHDGRLLCAHSNYPAMPERSEIKSLDPRTMELTTWRDFGDFGGSLTWVVRHDNAWWCNFAHYGAKNSQSFLARFDDQWREVARWTYPAAVLRRFGTFSASGGIWHDNVLLVTGHDERELYCLRVPRKGHTLEYVTTVAAPFTGQGIAIDPVTGGLVGIDRARRQIVQAEPDPQSTAAPPAPSAAQRRPNIVFLLADDLGYGDLGCFGQRKIRTPHLDRLAAEGMRFTHHYSGNAVCAPSRCVLMTGKHPGHAAIRNNREAKPEGQHPLPADTITLPRLLKELGYATGAFGKWGLGPPDSSGAPRRQGVDRFFGYNCQREAHNFYPTYLWDNDQRRTLDNPPFSPQQKLAADADPADPASYARYTGQTYAPDLITEAALQFVRAHRDRPFFLYYPTTVPHLALQIPEDSLREYAGKFDDEPYLGNRGYLPHRTPRAAYAAMVTRLDREIGRLVELVAELGLDEHTVFVFTSDNGPLYDRLGGTDTDFFDSAPGLRGRKGSLYEGGIRVPLIVRWKGQIAAGTTSSRVTGFEDWLPTLLELAGPAARIPAQVDGVSFAATLRGSEQPARPFLYREFPGYGGQQSVRVDDWKAVRQHLLPAAAKKVADGAGRLELYDLKTDPSEAQDVASKHPELVARLAAILRQQHLPSADFPLPALDQAGE